MCVTVMIIGSNTDLMNDDQKKMFVAWLNDAHALEESLVVMLEKQIAEEEDAEMKAKLEEHLEETKRHVELVHSCIARYGEEPSGGKDLLGTISSTIAGLGMSLMHDKAVKNVHSSYAAEHAEIATYTALRAAASEAGDVETVSVCDEILEDEKMMAEFLLEQLPNVVTTHLKQMV
jgi:ferritin-like metal-binding protein YciE